MMPSDQDEQEYRLAAAECLEEANRTSDQDTRRRLLIIAQKWFELANGVMAKNQRLAGQPHTVGTDALASSDSHPVD
jgi:hypothetical protein